MDSFFVVKEKGGEFHAEAVNGASFGVLTYCETILREEIKLICELEN